MRRARRRRRAPTVAHDVGYIAVSATWMHERLLPAPSLTCGVSGGVKAWWGFGVSPPLSAADTCLLTAAAGSALKHVGYASAEPLV